MNAIHPIDDRYDACIAPDGTGWYVHDTEKRRMSRNYSTKPSAVRALREGTIKWEKGC